MTKNLVIVESPAKAKTIQNYLGKDFKVESSFGHVRDLPSKGLSIDIEHNFKPDYEISPDKKKVVSSLKKAAGGAQTIWLATDKDREGEAIAWHLTQALKFGKKPVKRITFHEITKPAIAEAVENPGKIDKNLVDAQQARRILDRLVGYEMSPILWKKVQRGLSAGRVQSVAVRLIVEREREINAFKSQAKYRIVAEFKPKKQRAFSAELDVRIKDEASVKKLLEALKKDGATVRSVDKKPGTRRPSPPFTTSTLQQEASHRLGFSVKQTMRLAQRLYEAGHITYMRTDSLNLSDQALKQAATVITKEYGPEYAQRTAYKTKRENVQEAHEAIRPTSFKKDMAGANQQEQKLYRLVYRRALASQMSPAKIEKTEVIIDAPNTTHRFIAKGEIVSFDGFLKLYDNISEEHLPDLKVGDELDIKEVRAKQTFSKPKPRYTEASLVKQLEEMGIGRPSTYAPTISTIQDRGYVEKGSTEGEEREIIEFVLANKKTAKQKQTERHGADKNKLLPTDTADVVTDFLIKHFKDIVDYDFTATIEDDFDEIAAGKKAWEKMIAAFYKPFHRKVESAENVSRKDAGGSRLLGKEPKSKQPVYARIGRFGPMLQMGDGDDDEKPRFASMPEGEKIETITLKSALKMFELPRVLGMSNDGEEIISNIGRYGPYVKYGSNYVSIKPESPFTITLKQAKKLIKESAKNGAKRTIKEFDNSSIKVLHGRYGPYVTDGKTNAPVSKDTEPEDVDLKHAKELLADARDRKKNRVT